MHLEQHGVGDGPIFLFCFRGTNNTILDTLRNFLYAPLWRNHSFLPARNFTETHSLKTLFEWLIYANISN